MSTPRASARSTGDPDGVRVVERGVRRSVWLAALALLLLAAALLGLVRLFVSSLPAPPPPPPATPAVAGAADVAPEQRLPRRATPRVARPASAARPEAPPAGREPTEATPPGVVPSGIGLFPPPGTDPPRVGIVVPDDFELPEGYLRHYQATDDGQELAPILMFHPDYEWVDERGVPIELPADRVVPRELAPPGLAIELLEIPAPRAESDPAP